MRDPRLGAGRRPGLRGAVALDRTHGHGLVADALGVHASAGAAATEPARADANDAAKATIAIAYIAIDAYTNMLLHCARLMSPP